MVEQLRTLRSRHRLLLRTILLLCLTGLSFGLFAAAETHQGLITDILLGLLALVMLVTILIG